MKKRIISLLLALSMMISLVPVSALANTGGGITPLAAGGGSRTTNNSGSTISGGVHDDNISNFGTIEAGTFNGQVTNWYSGQIHHGIFNNDVWNDGLIMGGTFKGTVTNHKSSTGVPGIANGTGYKPIFVGKVINEGTVNGGIFLGDFVNETTTTSGNAVTGKVKNGIFKDDPEIDNVKSITVNGAAIKEVGYCDATEYDMSWGTTVYAASGTGVVIHVDTKVNAINGKDPSEFNGGLYDDGQMIIFTMPDEPVVLSYIAPKDLQFGEDGKPTAASGNGWTYDGTTLKLTSGEWNFLNDPEIRCNVDISKDAVLKDGTINATVKNYGTIEGGTIRFCDNYGTIVNGTFDNPNKLYCIWNYNLISDGVFEQGIQACVGDGMASKITGGTFKSGFYTSGSGEGTTVTGGTFASPPTNATGKMYSVSIGRWSGKCSIAINGVDFGENKSVYVVGQDYNDVKITATAFDAYVDADTNKTKKFKEWQISPTGATLNAVDGGTADLTQKEIEFFMPDSYKNITLAAKYETVTTPTFDPELVITNGLPDTSEEHAKQKTVDDKTIYYGNGWTYDGTTLKLNPTSAKEFTLNGGGMDYTGSYLKCDLEIGANATVKGTITFTKNVTNYGTIEKMEFGSIGGGVYPSLTNNGTVKDCFIAYASVTNNKTMKNVSFVVCSELENSADATIENAVVRTDDRTMRYSNSGKIDKAVFEFRPTGEETIRVLKAEQLNSDERVYAKVGECTGGLSGTEVYIVGVPELKVKIADYIYANVTRPVTNVNGDENYGGLLSADENGYHTFTVQSGDTELVLNQGTTTTTYTLTVEGGKTSTGKTSEELKEGTVVTVDTNVPDDKVFTGWTASDGVTLTHNGEEVDLSENHLVFNMPAKSFTLTANFETARTNILFNKDGTLNLDGVKNNSGDGWYYSEGALYLNPATATEYDFAHVDPQNEDGAKLDAVNVPIHVVNSTVTIKGGTFEAEVESTVADATFKNCIFKGEVDIQAICNVDNCIFTKSCTITNLYGEQNCLFEKEPGGSIVTYELTEASGATVTATLDGCEGEVSGTKLYFTGTPTLKVKVADGIVEKANDKDVGKADANGWYTVTAKTVMAEDDDGIVLTKGEKTTPNPDPDDQPKTYTVTVKGGTINNETEVKAEKDTELTVDVDEKEVPEGMTFDVWSISFPEGVKDTLTPSVKLHDPHMTFTMPEADITIEAQYRSSELPGEDDGPSALGTMATVAVGGAAAGILVWQGVSLGVDSYLQLNLPQGVAVPTNRRELVVLLWETAGKPETALPSLYSDVPAEEIELQKATRWAIDNGLVKPADDSDASRFDPDRYVTKYDVFGAWLKLKKLMKL